MGPIAGVMFSIIDHAILAKIDCDFAYRRLVSRFNEGGPPVAAYRRWFNDFLVFGCYFEVN